MNPRAQGPRSDDTIRIQRPPYSSVPDDVLTDERMALGTRTILAWMLGRSPDFQLHIWFVRRTFRLSEQQWVRVRKEMELAGYFRQVRVQNESGKFQWFHDVTYPPSPSPQKPGDGQSCGGQTFGGATRHGRRGDKPLPSSTNTSNTKQTTTTTAFATAKAYSITEVQTPMLGEREDGGTLVWPSALSNDQKAVMTSSLMGVDPISAQELLDEVAGNMERNSVSTTPERLLSALVRSWRIGKFAPDAGIAVRMRRVKAASQPLVPPEQPPRQRDPAIAKAELAKIHQMLRTAPNDRVKADKTTQTSARRDSQG